MWEIKSQSHSGSGRPRARNTGSAHTGLHTLPSPPHTCHGVGAGLTALLLGLVRAISTVILSVTLPTCRDAAARVLTPELVHSAGHLGCKGAGGMGKGEAPVGVGCREGGSSTWVLLMLGEGSG